MVAFRSEPITEILNTRPGLQRVRLAGGDRAYVLTDLIGDCKIGDVVVVNTTAMDLALGTGGWHVVVWNTAREQFERRGPGHIMKLRYTPMQMDAGSAEEHEPNLPLDLDGMPVIAALLHSQIAAVAVAIRDRNPTAVITYVMSDDAALPLALSDLVYDLTNRGLIDNTVTAGQAFGGNFEAVSLPSALTIAKHIANADIAIVAMGPGIVGTNSKLGFSGAELGHVLDWTNRLGGIAIGALRTSFADPRERHRGLSHHCATSFGQASHTRAALPLPLIGGTDEVQLREDLNQTGLAAQHDIPEIESVNIVQRFQDIGLEVTSMGRTPTEDYALFEAAAVAGVWASTFITPKPS